MKGAFPWVDDADFLPIWQQYDQDEPNIISSLIDQSHTPDGVDEAAFRLGEQWLNATEPPKLCGLFTQLQQQYQLSTAEGVALLCLAEALLRIPDRQTQHALIAEFTTGSDWLECVTSDQYWLTRLASWGLAITGKVLTPSQSPYAWMQAGKAWLTASSQDIVRIVMRQMVAWMSDAYVFAETMPKALSRAKSQQLPWCHSFDMLGEMAMTMDEADAYYAAYHQAIAQCGQRPNEKLEVSIKLSALYPRYEVRHHQRAIQVLTERLHSLALAAKQASVSLTVDAEESVRLGMAFTVVKAVWLSPELDGWSGFGLAIQAYHRWGCAAIESWTRMAEHYQRPITIRWVKGAYWDQEVKSAQKEGYPRYPVFTQYLATACSYLAGAELLLRSNSWVKPYFASHNVQHIAWIIAYHQSCHREKVIGFQKLHGMGDCWTSMYSDLLTMGYQVVVYAPVGNKKTLLPYLIRRLLENGANRHFGQQIQQQSAEHCLQHPYRLWQQSTEPCMTLPAQWFQPTWRAAMGVDWLIDGKALLERVNSYAEQLPIVGDSTGFAVINPSQEIIMTHIQACPPEVIACKISAAQCGFAQWKVQSVNTRAQVLECVADQLEQHRDLLIAMLQQEAGKVIDDAISEVREAADFCRYYAQQARALYQPQELPHIVGERNTLKFEPYGVVLCISPWNFPLAIFVGQIAAALVCGNSVVAKPAEQTPLIAQWVIDCFINCGCLPDALQCIQGPGEVVGPQCVADERIQLVAFTGSGSVARSIAQGLAQRTGPIVPLIAETGGINAMIVDSSALIQDVLLDLSRSAFGSAGQRCSACRIVCVHEAIADEVIAGLSGMLALWQVGDAADYRSDMGPLIDSAAITAVEQAVKWLSQHGSCVARGNCPASPGYFIAPQVFEISSLTAYEQEIFGPIVQLYRFRQSDWQAMCAMINNKGYGLTCAIHSRIKSRVRQYCEQLCVGNYYINRDQIAAVVGCQPFGGRRLSGTGNKAGGPWSLQAYCQQTCITENTAAIGGDVDLLNQ